MRAYVYINNVSRANKNTSGEARTDLLLLNPSKTSRKKNHLNIASKIWATQREQIYSFKSSPYEKGRKYILC